ncbi:MAG: hypothetical protein A2177_00900 [Spirochaetes bacterium RBG_13_68_11]|nr:MAG: hypothetical protein A2177_00900 [Spirochaetes bacterium RBG_13_68_11]
MLVLLKSTTAVEDPEFRALMLSVIRVEIEDRELEMIEPETPPTGKEQPLDSAKKAGTEFALAASYTMGEQAATFDVTWYETAAKTKSTTVSRKSALDFTLDVTIASAVVEILEGQKARILALPLKPDPNAVAVTPPDEAQVIPVELGKDVVRLEQVKPLLISLGAGPLISTFSATQYIQDLYFGAKVAFAWRFPMLGGAGGVGITSSYQKYYVTNVGHPGWFYGIPVGAQVQYGTRMPGAIDFFVHLDGGALIWYWDQDDGNLVNGVVWFIAGGVGLVVDILKNFGIAIDVAYSYYPLNPAFTFLEPSVLLLLKL